MSERIRVHSPDELSLDDWREWAAIRRATPELASPFFAPRFTSEVARVRDDVRVAVVERNGVPVAFLPLQNGRNGRGRPVGGRLSDFHGLVAADETDCSPPAIVSACGLRSWSFDHLCDHRERFDGFAWETDESPRLDLSEGFEAYEAERRRSGSGRLKKIRRKHRKLEREVGETTVDLECTDLDVFATLLEWKSQQYRESGLPDLFAKPWIVDLLRHLLEDRGDDCRGVMAVLAVDGRPLAIDYGLRSGTIFHSWFPAYDVTQSAYGPGNILLMATAERAEAHGITRIELGKGVEPYKNSFCNASDSILTGRIGGSRLRDWMSRAFRETQRRVKASSLAPVLRPAVRLAQRALSFAD